MLAPKKGRDNTLEATNSGPGMNADVHGARISLAGGDLKMANVDQ